jgi:hypothetical protein
VERLTHEQALLWLNDRLGRPVRASVMLGLCVFVVAVERDHGALARTVAPASVPLEPLAVAREVT